MEISDVLDNHIAIAGLHCKYIYDFNNVVLAGGNVDSLYAAGYYAVYMVMFQFRTSAMPTVGTSSFIALRIEYASVWVKILCELNNTQASSTVVNARLNFTYPGGNVASAYINLTRGKTYAIVHSQGTSSSAFNCGIYEISDDGTLIEKVGIQNSMNSSYTHALTVSSWFSRQYYTGSLLIYEPIYLGRFTSRDLFQDAVPRVWTGLRSITNTYYAYNWTWFMVPPKDANGLAYELASIGEWELLEHDDALSLQTISIDNGFDGKSLTSIWNQIVAQTASLVSDIGDVTSDVGAALIVVRDYLQDSLDLAAEFWSDVFKGETVGFKWEVIDDALSQVITYLFDALIGVFD